MGRRRKKTTLPRSAVSDGNDLMGMTISQILWCWVGVHELIREDAYKPTDQESTRSFVLILASGKPNP